RGAADLRVQVRFDPKGANGLPDLLPAGKVSRELLHLAPKDSLLTLTVALPDGARRWEKALELLDEAAAPGAGLKRPGKALAALEAKLGLSFGKDVCGKVAGLALAVPWRGEPGKDRRPQAVLVVEAVDAEAAEGLQGLVPRLLLLTQEKTFRLENRYAMP